MLKSLLAIIGIVGLMASAHAQGASLNLTFTIQSAPSTSVACPVAATFVAPVPAGTLICSITVSPSTWAGTIALSGADASLLAISSGASGSSLVVGASPLTVARPYAVTITANP